METDKIISIATIVLLVICMAGIYTPSSNILGGSVHNQNEIFSAGITLEDTLTATDAALSSTLSVTGATTLSDDLSISGVATISESASSTLYIGNTSASDNSGCLVLGDSSATGTAVYITATGATITATTTQPAACQ